VSSARFGFIYFLGGAFTTGQAAQRAPQKNIWIFFRQLTAPGPLRNSLFWPNVLGIYIQLPAMDMPFNTLFWPDMPSNTLFWPDMPFSTPFWPDMPFSTLFLARKCRSIPPRYAVLCSLLARYTVQYSIFSTEMPFNTPNFFWHMLNFPARGLKKKNQNEPTHPPRRRRPCLQRRRQGKRQRSSSWLTGAAKTRLRHLCLS
jgi:hypothetical protein